MRYGFVVCYHDNYDSGYRSCIYLIAQVQLSFLMVGHTHEDIDQVFSKVSSHMTKTSVYDMDGKSLSYVALIS